MSLNVIDLIRGHLNPAMISQASTQLGESESGISKAISAYLPTVVGGLANNSDKPGIVDSIQGASSGDLLGNLTGNTHASMITTILTAVFGNKIGSIVNSVAEYAGISNSSSSSLLNMVTGAAVGSVGKYATDNNMGAADVSTLLSDQKGIVSSLLPAGLSLASLGLGHWGNQSDTVATPLADDVKVTSYNDPVVEEPKIDVTRAGSTHVNVEPDNNDDSGSIWKWLIPLLLLLLAGWFIWKQCDKKDVNSTTTMTDSTMMNSDSMNSTMLTDSANMNNTAQVDKDIDLKGTMIKGYANGMEESMITFLNTDAYENAANDDALKSKWYEFDKVNFELGSATELLDGSVGQMQNLVAILKAYPNAKIKVGGYTDKTGSDALNEKLSLERAEYIKTWLGTQGVGSQVTGVEGYGSDFAEEPAAASNTERASDRNMAIRFTK